MKGALLCMHNIGRNSTDLSYVRPFYLVGLTAFYCCPTYSYDEVLPILKCSPLIIRSDKSHTTRRVGISPSCELSRRHCVLLNRFHTKRTQWLTCMTAYELKVDARCSSVHTPIVSNLSVRNNSFKYTLFPLELPQPRITFKYDYSSNLACQDLNHSVKAVMLP